MCGGAEEEERRRIKIIKPDADGGDRCPAATCPRVASAVGRVRSGFVEGGGWSGVRHRVPLRVNLFSSLPPRPLPFPPLLSAPARPHCLPESLFSCCWIPSYAIALLSVVVLVYRSLSALIPLLAPLAPSIQRLLFPTPILLGILRRIYGQEEGFVWLL